MAIVGGSQLLILDEPTAGVDYESSQHIQEIIKDMKKDRTIILTTQNLDEANNLADEIALLSFGRIEQLDVKTPRSLRLKYGYTVQVSCEIKQFERWLEVIRLEFEKNDNKCPYRIDSI